MNCCIFMGLVVITIMIYENNKGAQETVNYNGINDLCDNSLNDKIYDNIMVNIVKLLSRLHVCLSSA